MRAGPLRQSEPLCARPGPRELSFPLNPLAPAERLIPVIPAAAANADATAAANANNARPACLLNVFGTLADVSPKYKVNACGYFITC